VHRLWYRSKDRGFCVSLPKEGIFLFFSQFNLLRSLSGALSTEQRREFPRGVVLIPHRSSDAVVEYAWHGKSMQPYILMASCLITHRYNFTFRLYLHHQTAIYARYPKGFVPLTHKRISYTLNVFKSKFYRIYISPRPPQYHLFSSLTKFRKYIWKIWSYSIFIIQFSISRAFPWREFML
jgi:hypothetical protein